MSNSSTGSDDQDVRVATLLVNRKRKNSIGESKKESTSPSVSAIVGSKSSKHRRICSNNQVALNNNSNQVDSEEAGTSKRSDGQQPHRFTSGVKTELRYLTDFYPNQGSSDRRLTRSQTNTSSSSAIGESTSEHSSSSSSSQPSSQSCIVEKVRGRKKNIRSVINSNTTADFADSEEPAGPSSSYGSRIQSLNSFEFEDNTIERALISLSKTAGTSSGIAHPLPPSFFESNSQGPENSSRNSSVLNADGRSDVASSGILHNSVTQLLIDASPSKGFPFKYRQAVFDNHSAQLRNMQRTQAAHAASFLGSFVPRVQQLLGNHAQSNVRVATIMDGLRSSNEIRQAEAASDLAKMLLLGNEESLPNLPVKEIVNVLIVLLQKEHNFELMLTAARCMSNMLEALPRALPIVIEAVPYLLERLKRIECIDVAEQSLMVLEVMSRRNGKNIMSAGGIAAAISHLDFFSVPSQRLAFQIAANCAIYVTANDFGHVRDSLPELTQRLLVEDKRCLESVCTLFCRLVENVRGHSDKLREIAGQNFDFLKNIQQLLVIQPCAIGPATFQATIRMLRYMAAKCSDIAVALIDMDFARTIRFLIIGTEISDRFIEVVNRPPQHLQELVFLAGELLPPLPVNGIFAIDSIMVRGSSGSSDSGTYIWLWKDDSHHWLQYNNLDCRIIEMAYLNNETEVTLQINQNVYKLDLIRMVQVSSRTGKERHILRKVNAQKAKPTAEEDKRQELLSANPKKIHQVGQMLFPILVELDGSSSGPALRYESLRLMLRMIHPSDMQMLKNLCELPLAGHIASALASPRSTDLCVVASALQLVHILVDRLPDVFGPLFSREGVAYEVNKLSKMKSESPLVIPPTSNVISSNAATATSSRLLYSVKSKVGSISTETEPKNTRQSSGRIRSSTQPPTTSSVDVPENSNGRDGEVFASSSGRSRRKISPESTMPKKDMRKKPNAFLQSLKLPSFRVPGTSFINHESSSSTSQYFSSLSSSSANAIAAHSAGGSLAGTLPLSSGHQTYVLTSSAHSSTMLNHYQRERVRIWIQKEAEYLVLKYFSNSLIGNAVDTPTNITRMNVVAASLMKCTDVGNTPLIDLKAIILEDDVSPFEMNHSGVLSALCQYLTNACPEIQPPRKLRLKRFAAVFMSLNPDNLRPLDGTGCWLAFEILVSKLLASIAQLEQFQVKVTDMSSLFGVASGHLRGAQAMRFFQTHQIRCNLRRHPSCRELREWKRGHGTIKVDPLTNIASIEKYLLDRGIGVVRGEDSSGEDEGSDDDEMPTDGTTFSNSSPNQTRIEILINDEKVPDNITILQAIRQYSYFANDGSDHVIATANLFASTHTLFYRAVTNSSSVEAPQVAPVKTSLRTRERKNKIDEALWNAGETPTWRSPLDQYLSDSLPVTIDDPCVPSLILLRSLYMLNQYWWSLFEDEEIPPSSHAPLLSPTLFHCSKLNAKLSRQLSDFVSVAIQQIPKWVFDLVKAVPFIFTFSSRRNYLYSFAFGRDRALMHLVNQVDGGQVDGEGGRLTPRLERRKVSIRREDLLRQAEQALNCLGTSRAMLEVGFEGEVGTGFGPTLEFYSAVSREIQRYSLSLWHGKPLKSGDDDTGSSEIEYTNSTYGLYPTAQGLHGNKQREWRVKKFEFIGRLLGQALIDARMLDLPLNPVFFKWLCGQDQFFGLADLEMFDKELYSSLRSLTEAYDTDLEAIEQNFTLPSNESIELMKGGKNRLVNRYNVSQFVRLVSHWQLVEGVRREMEAVRRGFEGIVNSSELCIFTATEMEELFCGCSESNWTKSWNESSLQTAIKPDHGYTHDSDQIRWLVQMLASYDYTMQRKFLQFVTGSPKLPVGGFRSLNPQLTVVRKSGGYVSGEEELPSAMTCYNYLKIPPYSSYDVFRNRFDVALRFIYSFHLT